MLRLLSTTGKIFVMQASNICNIYIKLSLTTKIYCAKSIDKKSSKRYNNICVDVMACLILLHKKKERRRHDPREKQRQKKMDCLDDFSDFTRSNCIFCCEKFREYQGAIQGIDY